MNVEVRFFASLRERVGTAQIRLDLPDPAGLDDLLGALGRRLPDADLGALTAENVRLAVNQTLVAPPLRLCDGDEIAFLPPVTGG